MFKHKCFWHYEFIQDRPKGHQWRVADTDDDVICDFPTEIEAREYVRKHNSTAPVHKEKWG